MGLELYNRHANHVFLKRDDDEIDGNDDLAEDLDEDDIDTDDTSDDYGDNDKEEY